MFMCVCLYFFLIIFLISYISIHTMGKLHVYNYIICISRLCGASKADAGVDIDKTKSHRGFE